MSNWQTVTLEDVAESINTGLDAIRRAPIVEHQTNLRCLRIQDISQDKPFNEWGFTETKKSDYEKSKLTSGDIIIARTGGSIGVNKLIRNDLESVFNNGLARIRANKNFATPEFIYCVMQSINFKSHINAISSGTAAQPNMKVGDMAKFEFKLPPLNEQKKITETIFAFIDKIHLNTQINQTLEQIAQALFKSWFVDFDPVRAKAQALSDGLSLEQAELAAMQAISRKTPEELTALSQTQPERYAELAETAKAFPCEMVEVDGVEMPKGWNLKALSDLGQIICGKTPSKSNKEFYGNDVPFIKIPDMHNQVFITQTTDNLSVAGANSQSKKYIPPKSICVSCIATVGLVSMTSKPSHTNQQINSIIPNDEKTSEFLYLSLKQPSMTKYLKDLASGGSATLNLNTSTFSKIEIITPSKEIIDIFHNKVFYTFEKVLSNSIENKRLAKTRDLLLPRLLNGEI